MEITLKLLLYFIRDLHPAVWKMTEKDIFFQGTQQLFPAEEKYGSVRNFIKAGDSRYIYIATLSEVLAAKAYVAEDMVILVSKDCEPADRELEKLSCGIIWVEGIYEVPYLINRMIRIFNFLAAWDKNMHIAALEGKSVQELLDLSETVLEHPVIVFDAGFNVLAYTKNVSSEYENFQETIRNGYTDAKTMNLVKEHHIFSRLRRGELLVAPAVGDENLTNVYLAFYGEQNILGFACVFLNDEKADQGYLDLLKIFISNLTFCLKRDYENQRFGQMMYETFLLNLMNPVGISPEQVTEQVKNLDGLSEHGRFILGVFAFEDVQNVPLPFLARQMDHEMWDVKPFIYENYICLFRILDEEKKDLQLISDWEKQNISSLLNHYSYTLGVSNQFYQIMDLQYAFRQAKAAMRFGKWEGKKFCLYSDYYYYDLFQIMEEQMPVEHLKMGLYRQLQEYDKQNNTRYRKMILSYLKNDCNATHTAEKLFLHRNTIRKAVQFVEENWQVDLGDTEVKKRMVIGELADQYLDLKTGRKS